MSYATGFTSDVGSMDAILKAMYEVISGPAGQARDWDRFRALHWPDARLMPVVSLAGETPRVRVLSPEAYIARVEPIFATESFWERESGREVKTIGRVAHVLSHYESFHEEHGEPFERGTNSVQLFFDDTRWWIVSVMWNTNRSR